jgi:EAL domain-containing protein (putative c-di-GMP-specific phosphodiesterase class I)
MADPARINDGPQAADQERERTQTEEQEALRALRLRTARREIAERRRTAQRLRSALSQNAFLLLYQPQIHLKSREMRGAEAMLRLQHHRRGLVLPQYFMPLTERSEVVNEIGAWVLKRAFEEALQWPERLTVAISLSPRQLQGNRLIKTVIETLAQTGIDSARIQIQVTEAMLIDRDEDTVFNLKALHGLGIRLTVDHFGAGYASLAMLKQLPLSTLKLDRSMIQMAAEDESDAAMLRATIDAGHAMGCTILANGVETEEQCTWLEGLGCDEAQGPFFSQPLGALELLSKVNAG